MEKVAKKFLEFLLIFFLGSVIYVLIELFYRGHSHWTMAITGGICLAYIRFQSRLLSSHGLMLRAAFSAIGITVIEFAVGYAVNILLGWEIWDYSSMPLNICGQVSPLFSALWFLLSFPAIIICDGIYSLFNAREDDVIIE